MKQASKSNMGAPGVVQYDKRERGEANEPPGRRWDMGSEERCLSSTPSVHHSRQEKNNKLLFVSGHFQWPPQSRAQAAPVSRP